LAAVFPLLAPSALDVQTDGRLVRMERRQAEYWVWADADADAGIKRQWSRCMTRKVELRKYPEGFFADQLHDVLTALTGWLWSEKRRKRSYVNQVLARAEVGSADQPARKLWVRVRNGLCMPNPVLQLRVAGAWTLVYTAMAMDWVDRGCGYGELYLPKPLALAARLGTLRQDDLSANSDSGPAPQSDASWGRERADMANSAKATARGPPLPGPACDQPRETAAAVQPPGRNAPQKRGEVLKRIDWHGV